jgi:two-component system sensor histidine kinase GlrK
VLEVADEGPGVAADEREKIFDSFYQGRPPVDGRVKGSGLGLAIAREYALSHGGRIELFDGGDGRRGARFRLSLPLPAASGTASVLLADRPLTVDEGKG